MTSSDESAIDGDQSVTSRPEFATILRLGLRTLKVAWKMPIGKLETSRVSTSRLRTTTLCVDILSVLLAS